MASETASESPATTTAAALVVTDLSSQTLDATTNSQQQQQQQLKILAPATTRDLTMPQSGKKVPMIMVPVPDTGHLLAIPLSAINQYKDSSQIVECVTDNEQQARDLLNWSDGIGTLDGCDLRFKLNELGNLELLDSDDDSENQNRRQSRHPQTNNNQHQHYKHQQQQPAAAATVATQQQHQHQQHQQKSPMPVKQISPGSSLLRDGPDHRRPAQRSVKTSHQSQNNINANIATNISTNVSAHNIHNALVSERIVPKDIKGDNIEQWTPKDVRKFIDAIPGCDGCGEWFESQMICGRSLVHLNQRDLLDIIKLKLGPAVKIYHAISLLKSRSKSQ